MNGLRVDGGIVISSPLRIGFVVGRLTFMLGWFHRKNGAYDKERFRPNQHALAWSGRTQKSIVGAKGG